MKSARNWGSRSNGSSTSNAEHGFVFVRRNAKGVYDPFLNSQTYYESRTTPVASTIGGAVNGSTTQRQIFNDFGVSGFTPRYGGSYDVIFNQARTTSTNRNATLNPQFPTNLTASYIQPLWKGLRIDQNRRNIMIARKNVDLADGWCNEGERPAGLRGRTLARIPHVAGLMR